METVVSLRKLLFVFPSIVKMTTDAQKRFFRVSRNLPLNWNKDPGVLLSKKIQNCWSRLGLKSDPKLFKVFHRKL